ncbi:MAG: DEAD/DEAH box helicase [Oscillatoriales cyanobacterium]|nr:MAG: DEAD/DEAH box helicase [Oscillatoriales cyanobacterium]
MTFSSIIRTLGRSPLATELLNKLKRHHCLQLNGIARLPKGLVASALAQQEGRNLLAVTATLEEAGRWVAQLEAMGWQTVHFYPTSEASPYELSYSDENEMTWGQMQVLADLVDREQKTANSSKPIAIVATERALQPHLPPRSAFEPYCLTLKRGEVQDSKILDRQLASMGYDRVTLVETEGQWSRRGDIVDVFPVAAELPVRLEWFGDTLDQLREFDPSNQRSLDKVDRLVLTPTSFNAIIKAVLAENNLDKTNQIDSVDIENEAEKYVRRLLGLAFEKPACLLDYLPENTLVVVDEPQGCEGHSDRWFENAQEQWESCNRESEVVDGETPRLPIANLKVPKIHRTFAESIADVAAFDRLELSELAEDSTTQKIKSSSGGEQLPPAVNLSSRPVPVMPHQFAKLSQMLREERDRGFTVFLVSAQPSRSVSLLSEHDCPAQFVVNPRDFLAIDKLQLQHIPVALKYSGLAELEGFILPTFRIVLITDREFYGQHSLATFSYVRKRRRAASKKVDPNKLSPGDYVVHRQHGVGKFLKLERLTIDRETREYLVLQYADGTLRVAADQLGALSRFRTVGDKVPDLNKLTGQTWEKTKAKVRKAVKKVAVDLLNLYAKRAKQQGYAFPPDMPWQQELEDSFPYQPTPDQLKATLDVKRDMEGDRPMDRLVCGDVGFGKTEVALRAIFKAITAGKQVALLAPTTILTQQHYHTLSERFSPYPIEVGLLNRFRTETERREIHKRLATGELDVIVGTQSVLSKAIKFRDLGLLVVDEEQRFGVKQMVPGARIAIAHGQMDAAELESIMLTFSAAEFDILVCTTIIESGLDIPRVNTILIEDAQKFGLGQLYQLRGRVGRAGIQAHAWLFYPKQNQLSDAARQRLRAIQEFAQLGSGYQLAVRDMEIRGSGDVLGTEQSGQMEAIGFDLYAEMLEEAIREIKGQEIPKVEDAQIDLSLTAFIPADYIGDLDQKMSAYRSVASANTLEELQQIRADWCDRYGQIPLPAQQLIRVVELKQIAKQIGFSRIKPENKQHIVLETPMEEPAWNLLKANLPEHLHSRFVYSKGKVTIRGMAVLSAEKQLDNLIDWLGKMQGALPEAKI